MNDCSIKEKELICKIDKNTFGGHIFSKQESFDTCSYGNGYIAIGHELIFGIIIKYNPIKEDINVQIKKLLNGIPGAGGIIAYETDVTQISPCLTNYFELDFTLIEDSEKKEFLCFFKKYKDNKPLFLLCEVESKISGNYTLNEIKQEMKLEDISIKYNFIIKPVNIDEKINFRWNLKSSRAYYSIYPNIFDFTKKDIYGVLFIGGNRDIKGLAIEPIFKDLDCKYDDDPHSFCTIPKSYFKDIKNGYYYGYQDNHLGGKSPIYEVEPFKIILPDDSKSIAEKVNIFRYIFAMLIAFILF